jgi:hypothetical protein
MNEIAPGILHWTALPAPIGARVSSYFSAPAGPEIAAANRKRLQ